VPGWRQDPDAGPPDRVNRADAAAASRAALAGTPDRDDTGRAGAGGRNISHETVLPFHFNILRHNRRGFAKLPSAAINPLRRTASIIGI